MMTSWLFALNKTHWPGAPPGLLRKRWEKNLQPMFNLIMHSQILTAALVCHVVRQTLYPSRPAECRFIRCNRWFVDGFAPLSIGVFWWQCCVKGSWQGLHWFRSAFLKAAINPFKYLHDSWSCGVSRYWSWFDHSFLLFNGSGIQNWEAVNDWRLFVPSS